MRIACWIPKATNTRSENVILNAFPMEQWLRERASILRYTYTTCLVTSQKTQTVCSRNIARLVLYREIIAVHTEDHTEHTNTLYGTLTVKPAEISLGNFDNYRL